MKWTKARGGRLAGILEKLGIVLVVASAGDMLVAHRLPLWMDLLGFGVGLTFLLLAIIMSSDG